jgi:hypothetical protein
MDDDRISKEEWDLLVAIATNAIGAASPLAQKFSEFVEGEKDCISDNVDYDDNDMENPYPRDREDGEGINMPGGYGS